MMIERDNDDRVQAAAINLHFGKCRYAILISWDDPTSNYWQLLTLEKKSSGFKDKSFRRDKQKTAE
jgi:hypothetical protein